MKFSSNIDKGHKEALCSYLVDNLETQRGKRTCRAGGLIRPVRATFYFPRHYQHHIMVAPQSEQQQRLYHRDPALGRATDTHCFTSLTRGWGWVTNKC